MNSYLNALYLRLLIEALMSNNFLLFQVCTSPQSIHRGQLACNACYKTDDTYLPGNIRLIFHIRGI